MDPSLYLRMAEVEDAHWWFASRRAIVDRIIERLGLPPDAAILEPGCGTGGNFPMLARRGRLFAIDADESTPPRPRMPRAAIASPPGCQTGRSPSVAVSHRQ